MKRPFSLQNESVASTVQALVRMNHVRLMSGDRVLIVLQNAITVCCTQCRQRMAQAQLIAIRPMSSYLEILLGVSSTLCLRRRIHGAHYDKMMKTTRLRDKTGQSRWTEKTEFMFGGVVIKAFSFRFLSISFVGFFEDLGKNLKLSSQIRRCSFPGKSKF